MAGPSRVRGGMPLNCSKDVEVVKELGVPLSPSTELYSVADEGEKESTEGRREAFCLVLRVLWFVRLAAEMEYGMPNAPEDAGPNTAVTASPLTNDQRDSLFARSAPRRPQPSSLIGWPNA